jgi:hypothetical protein
MYSSISLRLTLLEQPELGQVLVSISPISVPRWVLTTILDPQPGFSLDGAVVGELADHFIEPKRTTRVLGP